ncbi:calpastatin [Egretta garzetta]|uniref:calpastatin n=1 Tax=Egretta garzetta TaxID=188379 RepID=UPI00163CB7EC|nr:calpastatin [Egretta garzetta]
MSAILILMSAIPTPTLAIPIPTLAIPIPTLAIPTPTLAIPVLTLAIPHGDKKASGASSKPGEKKADAAEKKTASADVSQPPKPQASGAPSAVKKQPPSVDASKPQIMKPSEAKSAPTAKTESGKNAQSTKPTDSQNKQPSEKKQKEPNGAKSQTSPSATATSKPNNTGKVTAAQGDQPPQATSIETAKPESEKMAAAGAGAAGASVVAAADKSSTEPGMDESALDSLIDTLGGPEDDVPTSPVYTGPEVTEAISSRYLEEMGKREGSLPPEYVKLLKGKGDGKDGVPPKIDERDEKPMTEDELAEALSSDFTCSTASAEEKKTLTEKKPSKEEEVVQAQAASSVKTSVPPTEKKKSKEEIKDDAVEALLDTLGGPEPEPEDLSPVVEVSEAKAKEKKEEKAGERDDTIPPEYRLTPELDKDGKPILPKPEEKPKPLSESDLVDEFSKDFASPAQPAVQSKPSKPSSTSKKPSDPVSAKTAEGEVVPRATACTVQSSAPSAGSSVGPVADEVLEALSSSLGKREPDPDEKKPAVDKVKEKTKQEECKKLGEDEETIPPEYRLTEAKVIYLVCWFKSYFPFIPQNTWVKLELHFILKCRCLVNPLFIAYKNSGSFSFPMSENDLLEGLTEGFSCSPSPSAPLPTPTVIKKTKEGKKPAGSSDVISAATVSSVHSAAPLPPTSGGKEMDEALDLLSDSLGQREPDPDEGKPVVDKVKEKAKSEHRDKLGERDDTIPPDYLKLLESGEQGKPVKPTAKDDVKHKEEKKPASDSAAIDALSADFDASAKAPATPQHSKEKSGKETITTKPSPKDKGRPKDPKTAEGQPSSSKPEKQKAS